MKIEASVRLKATSTNRVNAAAVPTKDKIKLLKELFKNAKLKRFGLENEGERITGDGFDTNAEKLKLGQALAALGWNTKWKKGVSREDGTWPLVIDTDKAGGLSIEVWNQDNVDKNVRRQSVKDYKAIVKEVASALGAKTSGMKRNADRTGAGVGVTNGKDIPPAVATKTLMKLGYKKPTVTGNQLHFAKEHATVILDYNQARTTLESITCTVI